MSTDCLVRDKVYWNTANEQYDDPAPFGELDRVLSEADDGGSVSLAQVNDRWYLINDGDIESIVDPTPPGSLDTWDF